MQKRTYNKPFHSLGGLTAPPQDSPTFLKKACLYGGNWVWGICSFESHLHKDSLMDWWGVQEEHEARPLTHHEHK